MIDKWFSAILLGLIHNAIVCMTVCVGLGVNEYEYGLVQDIDNSSVLH